MRNFLGYIFLVIAMFLSLPAKILVPLGCLIWIIITFIKEDFWNGVITIGISVAIIIAAEFLIYFLLMPIGMIAGELLENKGLEDKWMPKRRID